MSPVDRGGEHHGRSRRDVTVKEGPPEMDREMENIMETWVEDKVDT